MAAWASAMWRLAAAGPSRSVMAGLMMKAGRFEGVDGLGRQGVGPGGRPGREFDHAGRLDQAGWPGRSMIADAACGLMVFV